MKKQDVFRESLEFQVASVQGTREVGCLKVHVEFYPLINQRWSRVVFLRLCQSGISRFLRIFISVEQLRMN